MNVLRPRELLLSLPRYLLIALAPLLLLACGGGGGSDASSGSNASISANAVSSSSSSTISLSPLSGMSASAMVTPAFHTAPVVLNAPSDVDRGWPFASAYLPPAAQTIGLTTASPSTSRLTPLAIARYAASASSSGSSTSTVTTYTPAQIRAAYGLPVLPSSWSGLSVTQSAQMGAGQTIYLIDAMSDPNVVAELATFSQTFGLPSCSATAIPSSASLPVSAASNSGCQFSVVYSNTSGAMTSLAPAYDSGWATEIALDVQWAHATAPLARIILIEAPDPSTSSLLAAVNLANAMGPGVVSMSFGAAEGTWTASVDSAFSSANMTYVAATGDSGTGVQWPSVSSHVLAVGGTALTYSGTARTETVWTDTGGGISQYTSVPSYQTSIVPGMGALSMRSVADVSFNADPYTGQYIDIITPGSSGASWYSAGGTSLATPQWAGITAVANAIRVQQGLGTLGLMQTPLYDRISTNASLYASAFDDITVGSDGSCSTCSAHVAYDQPSGLGTPNVTNLLSTISTTSEQAPVVSPVTVGGVAGSALSFSVAVTSPDAVTWSLANAPQGMTINAAGQVTWRSPLAGSYSVKVTATDSTTGLSGSAVVSVKIVAPSAPIVQAATVVGQVGQALTYQIEASSADPVTFSISGAPAGMSLGATGMMTWMSPVAGTYSVIVTATDAKTGLSGSATMTVRITAATAGPVITASPINGVVGHPVTGIIGISDPGASYVNVSIKGVPAGMTFSASGQAILVGWLSPVAGTYTITVTATDSSGLSSQASFIVTISAQ